MNLFLIGLPGVGKTHFGKKIARHFGLTHIDLDANIEHVSGRSITALFDEDGEDRFRQLESECLESVLHQKSVVVSTGGGTPCYNSNLDKMMSSGVCIYLKDDLQSISARILAEKTVRPMFLNQNQSEIEGILYDLLLKRRSFYEQTHIITGLEAMHMPHLLTNRLDLFTKSSHTLIGIL